jgi:hypothetical protein
MCLPCSEPVLGPTGRADPIRWSSPPRTARGRIGVQKPDEPSRSEPAAPITRRPNSWPGMRPLGARQAVMSLQGDALRQIGGQTQTRLPPRPISLGPRGHSARCRNHERPSPPPGAMIRRTPGSERSKFRPRCLHRPEPARRPARLAAPLSRPRSGLLAVNPPGKPCRARRPDELGKELPPGTCSTRRILPPESM